MNNEKEIQRCLCHIGIKCKELDKNSNEIANINFKIESSDIKLDLIAKNKRDISEAYKILEKML